MIKLIYGKKGTGKTKQIIDLANAEVEIAEKSVVFVTKDDKYTFQIKPKVRFFSTDKHDINTEEELLAYINGILDSNHDIEAFYIDGAHRIANKNVEEMEKFYAKMAEIDKNKDILFVLTASIDFEEMPSFLKRYTK